ncbi:CAP domain-containing protein [Sphingomonas sp. GC_Shp_3]|uniref:CAP domain-containing protein n=1 Tax=Sphingomonas sp. GC_Shp_3 TaxID=2937383 RepID=UPI002269DD80|nr:CAP domain-containing protein [Sphingomonas sp. GC_Shp_3]
MYRHAALTALLLTTACGGGSNTGGDTAVVPGAPAATTPAPTPAPVPTPTPSPPPNVATGPDNVAAAASFYVSPPSATNCVAGQLKASITAQVLAAVNGIRALHRLPPVGYSTADEPAAQAASLMMAANGTLSHTPPTTWKCYSDLGAAGAGSSDLAGAFQTGNIALQSDDAILGGLMDEVSNIVANNVGHRRWILDPFATTFSYGRTVVSGSTGQILDFAALKVFNNSGAAPAGGMLPAFVAYPYGDYPTRYFKGGSLFSFGVIANAANRYANTSVNYASATVRVAVHGGAELAVSNISSDTAGYGLPNNLQFAIAGITNGTSYDVTIANVSVNGAMRSYSYQFRIVP